MKTEGLRQRKGRQGKGREEAVVGGVLARCVSPWPAPALALATWLHNWHRKKEKEKGQDSGKTEREENNYVSTQLPEVAMEICYCDSDGGVSESEV